MWQSGAQGCFPLSSSLSFQYSFSQAADGGTTLRLIGYYLILCQV